LRTTPKQSVERRFGMTRRMSVSPPAASPKDSGVLTLWIRSTILPFMAKARAPSADRFQSATLAVAERPLSSETKGSINLRIESHTRQLIDDAAAVLGKTRTEFMIDSARSLAIDVLLDQRLFVLDTARYDAFIHALDNPPAPGPKLRALLRRVPAWEK
jgi:uncharacterized protein (DUF1778 family)